MTTLPPEPHEAGRPYGLPASDPRRRFERCLASFVLRARRVEAHSLAADRQRLMEVAAGTVEVRPDLATGGMLFVQDLPPEEQVESAAARLRPLLLENEDVFHGNVFNAIGYYLRVDTDPSRREQFEQLRNGWRALDPRGTHRDAYSLQITPVEDGQPRADRTSTLSDNELAFAWLYGDVVHHDPDRLTATGSAGVRERYRAAAPLVCRIVIRTIATLRFVELLTSDGLLPVSPAALAADVVVAGPVMVFPAKVFLSASDAPLPEAGQPPGKGWTPL